MGNEDTTDDALDERRQFVRELDADDGVRRLTFTRDEFRTVLLELEPEAELREEWRRTAARLGYTVERLGTDDSLPDWPADAWVFRVSETTDRPTLTGAVREAASRVRAFLRRLLGRSRP